MEANKEIIEVKKSNLYLENRNELNLTGVEEVICFNDKVIVLETKLGTLTIKGDELKMNKLDVQNGDVLIVGQIHSCAYSTNISKNEKDSIIARLFR